MRFRDTCVLAFCRLGVAGLAPKAPGTWGTALACLLAPFVFLPLGMGWRVLALLLLAAAFVLIAYATMKIYSASVLYYGQRLKIRDLIKIKL